MRLLSSNTRRASALLWLLVGASMFSESVVNAQSSCITACGRGCSSVLDPVQRQPNANTNSTIWCPVFECACPCVRSCGYDCDYDPYTCPGPKPLKRCSVVADSDVFYSLRTDGQDIPTGHTCPVRVDTTPKDPSFFQLGTSFFPPLKTEGPGAKATAAISGLFVLAGILGPIAVAVTAPVAGAASAKLAMGGYGGAGGAPVVAPPAATGFMSTVVQCAKAVDPVSLLLHFQFMSTTGLLSLAYPENYLGFTYNFAWANFLIPAKPFKQASIGKEDALKCWRMQLDSNDDTGTDSESSSFSGGLDILAARFGIPTAALGGLVSLSVMAGVAILLLIFMIISIVVFLLEMMTRQTRFHPRFLRLRGKWPMIASNTSLRLLVWAFSSIATFAFYQFSRFCAKTPLALSILELIAIFAVLITVSVFIVRVAKQPGGVEMLFDKEEGAKYAPRWGSLYSGLQGRWYWVFIPQFGWTLMRSAIVAFGQGHPLEQVCAFLGLEAVITIATAAIRPYESKGKNIYNVASAAKSLISSALLPIFLGKVNIAANSKHAAGAVLITIGAVWTTFLGTMLLVHGGVAFIEWRKARKEQKELERQFAPHPESTMGPATMIMPSAEKAVSMVPPAGPPAPGNVNTVPVSYPVSYSPYPPTSPSPGVPVIQEG